MKAALIGVALWALIEQGHAAVVEPLPAALKAVLGPVKVKPLKEGTSTIYFDSAKGAAGPVAFIEKLEYKPNCWHTWVIGVGPDGKITQVRVQDLTCPHANPIKAQSFLDQFKGKGPADVAKLTKHEGIDTIAKATGSCDLTSDAVAKVLTTYPKIKGKLK